MANIDISLRAGQIWERDGQQREIVKIIEFSTELEVSSFYVDENGLYDHAHIVWRRPGKTKTSRCWCATWMNWFKEAKRVQFA